MLLSPPLSLCHFLAGEDGQGRFKDAPVSLTGNNCTVLIQSTVPSLAIQQEKSHDQLFMITETLPKTSIKSFGKALFDIVSD